MDRASKLDFKAVAASLVLLAAATGCRRAAAVPVSVVNNLAIATVQVNDSGPLSFIVDTGAAATVIHADTARAIGLLAGQAGEATTGGGAVATADLGPVTIALGNVRLDRVNAISIDLTGLRAGLGQKIDGILGVDLFDRFVVEFDYAGQAIRLHDPATFTAPAASVVLPLRLDEGIPFVKARLRTDRGRWVDAEMEFDTGQTGALTLQRPYLERERVFISTHPAVTITTGAIIAGGIPAQVTRIGALQLGSIELEEPVVTVTPTAEAAGVPATAAGILGGDVLRRFRVFVDYSRRRAILEPTESVTASFVFDTTGISLAAVRVDPPEYRVRSLIEGSPAKEAGIMVGDVLTAIDGRPAAEMPLTRIRELFREPGRRLRLAFLRDGEARTVTIVSRPLV